VHGTATSDRVELHEVDLYAQYVREYQEYRLPLIEGIARNVEGGTGVELESGLGMLTTAALQQHSEVCVIGIESNQILFPRMLRAVHELGCDHQYQLIKGDPYHLPFNDNSVAFATSTDAVRNWRDPVQVLREIYRIVRKGGHIYIHDLRRDAPKGILQMVLLQWKSRQLTHGRWFLEHFVYQWKKAYTKKRFEQLAIDAHWPLYEIIEQTAMTQTLHSIKT
jgi:ubiquinone/menaquinone biosynthesis C-methylase UbiE